MTTDEKNALADVLATKFNHAERRVLLNELDVSAEDVTLRAATGRDEAWEIVGFFERRDRLDQLRAKVEGERPHALTAVLRASASGRREGDAPAFRGGSVFLRAGDGGPGGPGGDVIIRAGDGGPAVAAAHGRRPARLFVSYARVDAEYCRALSTHLATLRTQGLISEWHDGEVVPGEEWAAKIRAQLAAADIIVLLLSADFFASEYINRVEIPHALERHTDGTTVVVPVVVRAVEWKHTALARIQGLPENAKPVKSWADQDEAWANVAAGIKRVVEALGTRATGTAPAGAHSPPATSAPPSAAAAGGVTIGGDVNKSVIVIGSGNNISTSQGGAARDGLAAASQDRDAPKLRLAGSLEARRAAAGLIAKGLPVLRREERACSDYYYSGEFDRKFVYNLVRGLSERAKQWSAVDLEIVDSIAEVDR